jgi:hypothetical protein
MPAPTVPALSEGYLEEDVIECNSHGYCFNVSTGEVTKPRSRGHGVNGTSIAAGAKGPTVGNGASAAPTARSVARQAPHMRVLSALVLALAMCLPRAAYAQDAAGPLSPTTLSARYAEWTALAPGFELRAIKASRPSRVGDELIVVARIDPKLYEPALAISAAKDKQRHTARDWADREGLVAAINAGMFQASVAGPPVGFTRADGVTLNPVLTPDRAALAFGVALNAGGHGAPASAPRILDRDCDNFGVAALSAYANVLQGIRLISCYGHNVWTEQAREWSTAAIATDAEGRILFVHVRSPYSVHTFAEMLKGSSLGVTRAIYLEGGPEATLFVHVGGVLVERIGSYETGFHESDDNVAAWPLPNVIGVRPRR